MINELLDHYGKDTEKLEILGEITEENLIALQKYIIETSAQHPNKKFLLIITTKGGDAFAAYNFYSWARFWDGDLITVALGTVFSAGFTLFLAGKERLAFPSSVFMSHGGNFTFNKPAGEKDLEEKLMRLKMLRIILHDIFKENLNLSDEEIAETLSSMGKYFTCSEALKIGLINKIV